MKRGVVVLLLLVACAQVERSPVAVREESPLFVPVEGDSRAEVPALRVEEIVLPRQDCSDSDGDNIFVRGTAMSGNVSVIDSCLFARVGGSELPLAKLVEYSCDGGSLVADVRECEVGCSGGACVGRSGVSIVALAREGKCLDGNAALSVRSCSDGCLGKTQCSRAGLETRHLSLPWQLSCIVEDGSWAKGEWIAFESKRAQNAVFFVDVLGSEDVVVEVIDGAGNIVAVPVARTISVNRCLREASGRAQAYLGQGVYSVRVAARASGPDYLRSFSAVNLSVALWP